MALVNETFLQHEGSTDVITFDHRNCELRVAGCELEIHGELFVCMADAIAQAKAFKTTWQSEVVRYIVHGVLHLLVQNDPRAAARRKMKRDWDHRLRALA